MSDKDLMIQITDYLFDKGHAINKPLITDIVDWVGQYGSALYEQGRISAQTNTDKSSDEQPNKLSKGDRD